MFAGRENRRRLRAWIPLALVLAASTARADEDAASRGRDVALRDDGTHLLVRYSTDGEELQRFTGFGLISDLAVLDDHTVVVSEQDRDRVTAVDLAGRIVWEVPVRRPRCVQPLEGERLLVCREAPPSVAEIDRSGAVRWELTKPLVDAAGALRLPGGRLAVVEGRASSHALRVFGRKGKLLWSGTQDLAQPRGVARLPSGELITSGFDSGKLVLFRPFTEQVRAISFCCHAEKPSVGPDGTIVAASPEKQLVRGWRPDGNVAWGFPTFYPPSEVELLPDGTVLVALYRIPDRTCLDAAKGEARERAGLPPYLRALLAGAGVALLLVIGVQWPVLRRRFSGPAAASDERPAVARCAPAAAGASIARRIEIALYVAAAAALGGDALLVHERILSGQALNFWPYAARIGGAGLALAMLQLRLPGRAEEWTARMRTLRPMQRPTWRMALLWLLGTMLVGVTLQGIAEKWGDWLPGAWAAGLVLLAGGSLEARAERSRIRLPIVLGGALLVALLLALRVYRLEDVPPNLHHDMAQWTLQAFRLVDGDAKSLFTNGWAQIPMSGYLWSALVTGLADRSLAGARLPAAIGGVVALVATTFLVRRLYGWPTALVVVLLLGVDHVFLHFSRIQAYMDPVPFHVLAVLGLVAGMESGRYGWFALAGLTGGCSTLTYHAGRITPPVLLLLAALVLLRYPRALLRRWPGLLLCSLTAFAVAGTQAVVYATGQADALGRVDQFAWVKPSGIDVDLLVATIRSAAPRVFGSFWFFTDASTQYGGSVAFFPPVGALLGMAAVAAVLRPWDVRGIAMIAWLALVLFVGGVLTRDPPFWPRLVIALVPATIAAGAAFVSLCRGAVTALGRPGMLVGVLAGVVLLGWNGRYQLQTYHDYVEGRPYGGQRPMLSTQWVQSRMGRDAQRWGRDVMIYIVAPNPIYHSCTHPTTEYYLYGMDAQDARDIREYLPFDRRRTTVAYFLPDMKDSITAVKHAHPGARVKNFYDNLDQHVFTRVVVPRTAGG